MSHQEDRRRRGSGAAGRGFQSALFALALLAAAHTPQPADASRQGSFIKREARAFRRLLVEDSLTSPAWVEDGSHGLQHWLNHFRQQRRLQQTGSVTGGIIAVTPSGAPLLRRADRNQPAGNTSGSVGQAQLYKLSDQEARLVTESLAAQPPGASSERSTSEAADTTSPSSPAANSSSVFTLAYKDGYASFSAARPFRIHVDAATPEACGALCASEPACTAWTRIAGGSPGVLSCQLFDGTVLGQTGPAGAAQPTRPTFQASGSGAQAAGVEVVTYIPPYQSPLIVESGTRTDDTMPSAAYGCPYPPSDNGQCVPPANCNCFAGVCHGPC